jgi:hypothetical protein
MTTSLPSTHLTPAVRIPRNFTINEVPFNPYVAVPSVADNAPDLGPLAAFKGTLTGRGFNTIFRPQNSATPTLLSTPRPDSDNILELNLTIESLSFSRQYRRHPQSRRGGARHLSQWRSVPAGD